MANGNGNTVVAKVAAALAIAVLLAWLGALSKSGAVHADAEDVARAIAAVEARTVAADLSIKQAIAGSEERLTRRLERIEDLVTHPPGSR